MIDQCRACDRGEHSKCDGCVTVIDQDGHSRYICQCSCRRWEARCPDHPEWVSGYHLHHTQAEDAFDRHIMQDHRPQPVLSQPNRGKDRVHAR